MNLLLPYTGVETATPAADRRWVDFRHGRGFAFSVAAGDNSGKAELILDGDYCQGEAYLKLAGAGSFATKSQFFRAAAQAMRRILIDHARATAFRDWAYARAFLSAALGGEKNSQNP